MEAPTMEHMATVKRVLRYVAGTPHFGCHYTRKKQAQLVGYSDSDLAGDVDTEEHYWSLLLPWQQSHHLAISETESCSFILL
jgi:hypothetical protein